MGGPLLMLNVVGEQLWELWMNRKRLWLLPLRLLRPVWLLILLLLVEALQRVVPNVPIGAIFCELGRSRATGPLPIPLGNSGREGRRGRRILGGDGRLSAPTARLGLGDT